MLSLYVRRGSENARHIERLIKARGPQDTSWDNARLIIFAAKVGARRIAGTETFIDGFGWRYRLKEVSE